jgi:voltage-gated potassium channel
MARRIADLREHVIICGAGKTGQLVVTEMLKTRTPLVCIEIDPTREPSLRQLGPDALCIVGDATDEQVLREAKVEEARGLVACLTSDRDNLFVVLTAREMNPRLRIVSRLAAEDARRKLLKAGADAVVSGRQIGALRLASEMLRPNVVSVLDAMLRAATDVRVEEIPVGTAVAGQPLAALQLEQRAGVTVFAMRETDTGHHVFNPSSTRVLREGDVLIACADADQLRLARRAATGQA